MVLGSSLYIYFSCGINVRTNGVYGIAALFQDAADDAIASVVMSGGGTLEYDSVFFQHVLPVTSTLPTTFKIRGGPNMNDIFFNGFAGGPIFNGAAKTTLIIMEVAP